MKIEVINLKEHEDGSATIEWDVDEEAKRFLIEYAIMDILTKEVKEMTTE
jgi:hypothetical protein